MPPRRKQPPATEAGAVPSARRIARFLLPILGFALAICGLSTLRDLLMGPPVPIPRGVGGVTLGMTLGEVLHLFPEAEKKMTDFNHDPDFGVLHLVPGHGFQGPSGMDLLFHLPSGKLFFISATWEGDGAKAIPVADWARRYRRWKLDSKPAPAPTDSKLSFQEAHFKDPRTEMVLRDLNYPSHLQRWQDLRDASNADAEVDFEKYREKAGI